MVPHNTLPGEIHCLWYSITHCQVKYTGCGTVWHIARLHWSWYLKLYHTCTCPLPRWRFRISI